MIHFVIHRSFWNIDNMRDYFDTTLQLQGQNLDAYSSIYLRRVSVKSSQLDILVP